MNQHSEDLEKNICVHIFTVSASMVGVCMTVIGIIHIVIGVRKIDTVADNLLAFDALLFLIASMFSYTALKAPLSKRMYHIERIADCLFMIGLFIMVIVSGIIAYAVA